MKEKCESKQHLQLLEIFCKIIFNFKIIVKSILDPDVNF